MCKRMTGPFDNGEVRELKGISPVSSRQYGRIGDASGTEVMESGMLNEAVTSTTADTPSRTNVSAWALRLQDPSPVSTVMSITPRATRGRARESLSYTPTPFLGVGHDDAYVYDANQEHHEDSELQGKSLDVDDAEEWPDEQEWGDDAMMVWDATSAHDDVSSVDREEAGLSDDDWGREALLAWNDDDDDGDDPNDNNDDVDDDNDNIEIRSQFEDESIDGESDGEKESVETADTLHARGMPKYRDWNIKDLQVHTINPHMIATDSQKLCKGYGYRPISKHDALVNLAVQCWQAMHPPPVTKQPRSRNTAPTRSSSISSADMPLANIRADKKSVKSKTRILPKIGKTRITPSGVDAGSAVNSPSPESLFDRFLGMIRNDSALWLRILRYEVSFPPSSA